MIVASTQANKHVATIMYAGPPIFSSYLPYFQCFSVCNIENNMGGPGDEANNNVLVCIEKK